MARHKVSKLGKYRIPSGGPRFGFGYRCPVEWKGRMKGNDGMSYPLKPACHGTVDPDAPRIELDASAPAWSRILAYSHEVVHMALDFERWVLLEIVEPMQREARETKEHLKED